MPATSSINQGQPSTWKPCSPFTGAGCQAYYTQGLKYRKYRPIFRVSANIDTIYPSDISFNGNFCNYWRFFVDISVFYRFFGIFPDISVLFTASALFMHSTFQATVHYSIKIVAWEVRTLLKTVGFQPPIH